MKTVCITNGLSNQAFFMYVSNKVKFLNPYYSSLLLKI